MVFQSLRRLARSDGYSITSLFRWAEGSQRIARKEARESRPGSFAAGPIRMSWLELARDLA